MDRGRLSALVPGISARALRNTESISPPLSLSHCFPRCLQKKKTPHFKNSVPQQQQPLLLSAADVAEAPVAALASAPPRSVVQLYRSSTPTAANAAKAEALAERARREVSPSVSAVEMETCFNVGLGEAAPLGRDRAATLAWLLAETFEPEALSPKSSFGSSGRCGFGFFHFFEFPPSFFIKKPLVSMLSFSPPSPFKKTTTTTTTTKNSDVVIEVGPRLSYASAWSTNAVSVCSSAGLGSEGEDASAKGPLVERLEPSRRYRVRMKEGAAPLNEEQRRKFAALVHDRMTEQVYHEPLSSFSSSSPSSSGSSAAAAAAVPATSKPVRTIPLLAEGKAALAAIDAELGLAFDEQDVEFYLDLFRNRLRRDPTDVELFDLAQSNSEHSRHWFFGARLVLDGQPAPATLMQLVKETLKENPGNSVIGFKDNSSAIRGGRIAPLLPATPGRPGPLAPAPRDWDILLTAETHNFPCAVAPYPGAETGAGGRIRDTHATGIGSMMGAATAGYCVGNLGLKDEAGGGGAAIPSEDPSFAYPPNLASPLQILIDSSNGASDYGNKFGEPLVAGYTRTFGLRVPSGGGEGGKGERREWIKPIMFSGGLGQIDHSHLEKLPPKLGMLVVKVRGRGRGREMEKEREFLFPSFSSTFFPSFFFPTFFSSFFLSLSLRAPSPSFSSHDLSFPQSSFFKITRAKKQKTNRSAAPPTASAWAEAPPPPCPPGAATAPPTSTSTPSSAATPRWPRSSGASCGPAASSGTATRSSRSTTRAPAATATSSRRSSTRSAPRSTSARSRWATSRCRCSRSGAPSTRRTTAS